MTGFIASFFKSDPAYNHWPALIRIMIGRLIILGCLLVALIVFVPYDIQSFYAFMALAFVINVPYALWLRNDKTIRKYAHLQFLADLFVITGMLHFTGGIRSELFLLYPLVILSAGIIISTMYSVQMTFLSILLYATLVALELWGILPYHGINPSPYDNPVLVVQSLMLRIFLFVFFTAASNYLAHRCFYQARQLDRYSDLIQTVLDNVSIGILTVKKNNTIMFVNKTAVKLLGCPDRDIIGRPLSDFFVGQAPSWLNPGDTRSEWLMKRANGTSFHVAFHGSNVNFASHNLSETGIFFPENNHDIMILAFHDVSHHVQAEADAREIERMQTTFHIALELGHEVRNPLTAIQGACETLTHVVRDTAGSGHPFSREDSALADNLCNIIMAQIKELDREINNFLMYAEENPAALLKQSAEACDRFCPKDPD